MKKRFSALLSVVLLMALLLATISGCFIDNLIQNEPPIALAIVLGRHANTHEYLSGNTLEKVQSMVKRAVSGGRIYVVVSDGEPQPLQIRELDENGNPVGNPISFDVNQNLEDSLRELESEKRYNTVMSFLKSDSIKAKEAETDILNAITVAANELQNAPSDLDKRMIILDNGIPTTGYLDFYEYYPVNKEQEILLSQRDAGDIIQSLARYSNVLPTNLKDVTVSFVGMGDSTYDQPFPDTAFSHLSDLWIGILEYCGAKLDEDYLPFRDVPYTADADADVYSYLEDSDESFPYVRTIYFDDEFSPPPLPSPRPSVEPTYPPSGGEPIPSQETLPPVPESLNIKFVPDSDEFLSRADAEREVERVIPRYVEFLDANPNEKIYIVGTTACVNSCFHITPRAVTHESIDLSERRAEAVKQLFISLDKNVVDRIEAFGLGSVNDPWHINEGSPIDPQAAQKNRKVMALTAGEGLSAALEARERLRNELLE
jgi:outer membrane protein OmpA-like peptidoglycan-associated protein/galactitol-specific phosphotransferase system IIB component